MLQDYNKRLKTDLEGSCTSIFCNRRTKNIDDDIQNAKFITRKFRSWWMWKWITRAGEAM